jgi:hypothetical protein
MDWAETFAPSTPVAGGNIYPWSRHQLDRPVGEGAAQEVAGPAGEQIDGCGAHAAGRTLEPASNCQQGPVATDQQHPHRHDRDLARRLGTAHRRSTQASRIGGGSG